MKLVKYSVRRHPMYNQTYAQRFAINVHTNCPSMWGVKVGDVIASQRRRRR